MPLPMTEPTRVASTLPSCRSSPACSIACAVAPTANWAKRSRRRACLRSTYTVGSNSGDSPAIVVAKPSVSNETMGAMPDLPCSRLFQVDFVSVPTGVIMPTPVT